MTQVPAAVRALDLRALAIRVREVHHGTGNLVIEITAANLGLSSTDDLDALVIVDEAPAVPDNALGSGDLIYYSLAKPSTSAADIFCRVMAETSTAFAPCAGRSAARSVRPVLPL